MKNGDLIVCYISNFICNVILYIFIAGEIILVSIKQWTYKQLAIFIKSDDGDTVKCYSCGGTLNDWQPNDDPWLEHAHWFPHCTHLIQVKGPEFVEDVIRNYGELVRAVS